MERASKRVAAQGLALADSDTPRDANSDTLLNVPPSTEANLDHPPNVSPPSWDASADLFRSAEDANTPLVTPLSGGPARVQEIEEEGGGREQSGESLRESIYRRHFALVVRDPGGVVRALLRRSWMNFTRWWPTVSRFGRSLLKSF